jgi:hypothetical protein
LLVYAPLNGLTIFVLVEHCNHVYKTVAIPFGERDCSMEGSVCVDDIPTWPILLASHVARTLTVHHIWLLNPAKPGKLSRVIPCVVQCGMNSVLVQFHKINFTTPPKTAACIAIAVAMLGEVDSGDTAALGLAHVHSHPDSLPQQLCRLFPG